MSVSINTLEEDLKFFDFLAPYRWPKAGQNEIDLYRELVQTGDLQIETVLENALAIVSNGRYKRIAEAYRDFSDDSDAKKCTTSFRNNNIKEDRWMNSAAISGISKKVGLIRALVYSRAADRFYFFAVPHVAYKNLSKVEIIMDNSFGYQPPKGIPYGKWTKCMVPTFEILATITPKQATAQWLNMKQGRGG